MPTEMMLLFVYPVSLILVIGFRIACAHQQPNLQMSRKVAQASYWGEYADQKAEKDKRTVQIAAIQKPQDKAAPQPPRDMSHPYVR